MNTLVGLGLLSLLVVEPLRGPDKPADPVAPQEWPPVRHGIWAVEGKYAKPGGKVARWKEKTSQCTDPSALFQGYWGRGIVEAGGCRFQSKKLSDTQFTVVAECMVRRVGVARSESTVTLKNAEAFDMNIVLREGKKISKVSQSGRWLSNCSNVDSPR